VTDAPANAVTRPFDLEVLFGELRTILGERATRGVSEREQHGRGETHLTPAYPDVVVYPESTDEVSRIVSCCARHAAPVIPFGVGSSLEGQIIALHGGVSIDMTRMDRVLRTSVEDLDVTVQAGVTRKQLTKSLEGTGVTFFVDPGADATIGGMLATGASGTTTVRYGSMRENTLGLTVVLADGSVVRTGSRARKSSAGYDLTRLMIGSEGTLGVITEATLRLQPEPDGIAAAVCMFDEIESAVNTVVALLQCGVPLARIELLDDVTVRSVNAFSQLTLPEQPALFIELHAFSSAAITEQLTFVHEVVDANGGHVHSSATSASDRYTLWEARHDVYYAGLAMRPGSRSWTTDACVPITHLAQCIRETRADVAASGLMAPLVGHVGDGNFHLLILLDPASASEVETAKGIATRLTDRAIGFGGTCTGEHGIGIGKMPSLVKQHGDALPVMRAIKHALDPQGIMNPGKLFD
jgi:D-lactate dehydrogenase (cytochrome)